MVNDHILDEVDSFLNKNLDNFSSLANISEILQQDIEFYIYAGIERCIELHNRLVEDIKEGRLNVLNLIEKYNKLISPDENLYKKSINTYKYTIDRYKKWYTEEEINKRFSNIYIDYLEYNRQIDELKNKIKQNINWFNLSINNYNRDYEYLNEKYKLYNLYRENFDSELTKLNCEIIVFDLV